MGSAPTPHRRLQITSKLHAAKSPVLTSERPLASTCPFTSFLKGLFTPWLFTPHPSVFLSLPGPSSICPPRSVIAEILQGSVLGPLLPVLSSVQMTSFRAAMCPEYISTHPCAVFTPSSFSRLNTQPNLTVNAQHYLLPRSSQDSALGPGSLSQYLLSETLSRPALPDLQRDILTARVIMVTIQHIFRHATVIHFSKSVQPLSFSQIVMLCSM